MEYITLNNGNKCPVIGIGTFMISPADAEVSVREALKMGYECVDTANAYCNERARDQRKRCTQRKGLSLHQALGERI